jgi:hypothetical protein
MSPYYHKLSGISVAMSLGMSVAAPVHYAPVAPVYVAPAAPVHVETPYVPELTYVDGVAYNPYL